MGPRNLHFTLDDFAERQEKARKAMPDQGSTGCCYSRSRPCTGCADSAPTWPPTWMEQPQIFANNSVVLEASTTFTHMILIYHDAGLTMSLGEQALVTEGQPEIITQVLRTPVIAR